MTTRILDLNQRALDVARLKAELGWTQARFEACRNPGTQRTPEKRHLLQRCSERAKAAGKSPIKAHF